jgi:hypothetical protein
MFFLNFLTMGATALFLTHDLIIWIYLILSRTKSIKIAFISIFVIVDT